jgi:lipoate-protein ligase A
VPSHPGLRLPHVVLSGAEQMLLDESLLHWAASGQERFAARTYGWTRPTLSLGRAEPFPGDWDSRALETAGVEVVRRPTGGDAVLHDQEVTFAVAASIPGPWATGPRAFAFQVAEALASALRGLGLPASVVAPGQEESVAGPPGASPCFARAAAGEVRVLGYKTAGIASRFTRGAALSHASIPLTPRHRDVASYRRDAASARAELQAHARSVGEAIGHDADPVEVQKLLLAALAQRFGVELVDASFEEVAAAVP